MDVQKQVFDELDGQAVHSFTITNDHGMAVTCISYGCIITDILVPDANGVRENVVLGFDSIAEYQQYSPYFGAVIGRVAGRIAGGEFELNGKTYKLAQNNGQNHLHGGLKGFDRVVWDAEIIENGVVFSYVSPDGEEGYPGTLHVKVTYTLSNDNELVISYHGVSDQDTLLNMTNHTYFNLSGNLKRDTTEHVLLIKSDRFGELTEDLLPTGAALPVEGTAFDFREGRKLVDGVRSEDAQNVLAGRGYDHPFLLNENFAQEIILADAESGRRLIMETDQPAVVLYSGTQMTDDHSIRGVQSRRYLGLCLETQGLPDAIHHPQFPSVVLKKDAAYKAVTKYKFTV
ncbi:aldose epimerase family protein [Ectobacillus ponti]|uniref:Aldose 1-epimerase n=1 Tax=Ectobacillus ponti TaxID=2961894 RepID=A0AA41X3B8_9BACI|nr:aldose epimerase family protein [Ectobacillus ponti]MCP8967957.1 galactose mutarotase [Ectobacillus ponti]